MISLFSNANQSFKCLFLARDDVDNASDEKRKPQRSFRISSLMETKKNFPFGSTHKTKITKNSQLYSRPNLPNMA